MKTLKLALLSALLISTLVPSTHAATTIVSDTFNVTTSGTGFALGSGVNTGINPPTTRITGSAASGLRYLQTVTTRPGSAYDINNNRLRITTGNTIGRFTLSANGTTPFDFGPSLGAAGATAANPVSYDVKISLRNDATGNARFSLGLGTVEGDINNMDFAVQMYRANSGDNFYTMQKRLDRGSFNGTTTTDGTGDINAVMATTGAGTNNVLVDFLIRVTDAGAESGANYNSRIQVSLNNGSTWIYDTDTDASVSNRFRFDGTERFFAFDQAPNTSGTVYYDAFSVTWNSGPRIWTGLGANGNWSNSTNWGGATPVNGGPLTFSGTTRQTNTNDLSGLSIPWLKLNNGGFALWGNAFSLAAAITNTAGNNTVNASLTAAGPLRVQSDSGVLTIGSITGGSQNLTVDGAGNTTATGVISGSGTLTKTGSGTLQYAGTGANTYSGITTINAGTLSLAKSAGVSAIASDVMIGDGAGGAGADVLRLDAANQIADTAHITISASGSFDLNNSSETVASVSSSSASSQIILGSGALTFGDTTASTFAGTITGTGDLVKQGTGVAIFSGNNSHSGTTTISSGVLNVQNGAALGGAGATFVSSGSTLEIQGGVVIAAEPITLNGNGVASAGALRNVSGNNSLGGAISLGSASRINSDSGTLTISGGITGGQALTVSGAGNTAINGAVASGSVTKDGSGTLSLGGANTYTGSTVVNAGTLAITTGGSIASSPSLTIANGATLDVSGVSFAFAETQTLVRNASSGVGNINGPIAFNSGAQVSLQADGLSGSVGTVNVNGGLTLNGNVITVNVTGAALGVGTYPLITYTGTKTGSFNITPVITGSGLSAGLVATIVENGGQIELSIGTATPTWSGNGANGNWSTLANWLGTLPSSGSPMIFTGTARQTSTNDLSGLAASWLAFNNGGFSLYGNQLTLSESITNASGINTLNGPLGWTSTSAKNWSLANGSRLVLKNTTSVETSGDHTLSGGGTLELDGTMNLGQTTAVNPAFVINSGTHIIDGGTFNSRGGYRVGANSSGQSDQTRLVLTNGANFTLTDGAANMRVGNSLNQGTGVLDINNSSLTLSGGSIAIPYTDGATGVVSQVGGTMSGGEISFSDPGAGTGSYTVKDGTLQPVRIRKNATAGSASIYFDNATLRPHAGAINPFMAGLNVAQIQSGGLTLDATSDVVINQVLSGSGALTKSGTAQVTLGTNNSYSGGTTLNAGTLNLGHDSALGTGAFTINGGTLAATSGARQISNAATISGNFTIGGSEALTYLGTIGLGSGSRVISVDNSGSTIVSGVISGSASLTKDGASTLQFSGASANTYSGGTVVNAGTLLLAKGTGVNAVAGNVTVGDGAGTDVLRLGAANQIPDSATVTVSAGALMDLNGHNETVAAVASSSASSQVALGAGSLTINAGAANTFAGVISGSGNVVKKGTETTTLSGANSYSGSTTVDGGKLTIAAGGSIASSSAYIINAGASLDVSGITFNVGSGKSLETKSSSGRADVIGNVTLGSGAGFVATANGGGSLVSKLDIAGNLTLNNNTLTVNVSGGALNIGTYSLITFTGSRTGTFNSTPVFTGSGLATGLAARVQHTAGLVSLFVYDPTATDTVFKVMHYNIHFGAHNGVVDTTDTSNFILNQNVDIVGMNEVDRFRDRSNNRDLPAEFAQKTGYNVVFTNIAVLTGNDESGNAVLSKHPILYRERILLPRLGDHEQRGLLKTVVDVKGKFVNFWSTHLDFHNDDTERLMCVTNFNTWVDEEVYPTIIAGDFNETPDQPTHARMELKWVDAWLEAGDGTLGRTAPCPPPLNVRIDYIWRVKGSTLTPTNTFVGYQLEESDHYPVLTRYQLNITTNRTSGFSLRFDEGSGTNILDSVGGLKGTLGSGAPTWSSDSPSGLPGDSSLYFNGTKRLTISDPKQTIGTNGANDNYTLQAWVKLPPNYAPAQRAIMFQYDRKPGFSFSIHTNRTLHTTAFKLKDVASTATVPNDGEWHHVAVVHTDGANMKFYIDATLAATVAYTNGAGYRTGAAITVGADPDGANPFTGYLARLKFDNRALTPSQFDAVASPQLRAPIADPLEVWKASYAIADLNADADGDGQSNYAEYIANTSPTDATSLLKIINATSKKGVTTLTWLSVGGTRYRIQKAEGLDGAFVDVPQDADAETDTKPRGTPSTKSFTDNSSSNKVRFYRIKVVQ